MAILLGYRGEQHVPRALESGQLSGHCGLRIWLNGERPAAIDPKRSVADASGAPPLNLRRAEQPGLHRPRLCASVRAEKGSMTEKRKLAAILAADVVGFSRLAGANEDRI